MLRDKYQSMDSEDILKKILENLRGKKQSKSLPLLKKFLLERFDLIRPIVLFNTFIYLIESDLQDVKTVEEIYFHYLEIADSGEFTEE